MQDVAFQLFRFYAILQLDPVVWIHSSPLCNRPVEKADLPVRIPKTVADEPPTKISAAIHCISLVAERSFFCDDGSHQ